MRTKFAFLLLSLIGLSAGFSKEADGKNLAEIVWSAPTNHLPAWVWVYKFVPQTISPVVISNLMALGSFTAADQTNIAGQPPFKDRRLMYFKNKNGARELGVFPPFGFVYFYDRSVEAKGREKPVGIPSENEAYQLGLEYLEKLGVDRSQLAIKADGAELRTVKTLGGRSWFDKQPGTNVETTYMRGVYFIRRVNGIDFDGMVHGGANFEFENDGKISRLELLWKGLEPYELHSALTPEQLIALLRDDNGKWQPSIPRPPIKKITVTEATPFYRGFPADDEEHKFLEPYIRLVTLVDTGTTNFVADFDCSLLTTNRNH